MCNGSDCSETEFNLILDTILFAFLLFFQEFSAFIYYK